MASEAGGSPEATNLFKMATASGLNKMKSRAEIAEVQVRGYARTLQAHRPSSLTGALLSNSATPVDGKPCHRHHPL